MIEGFVVLLTVFVLCVYSASHYNHLITLKHNVTKAWSNIDVLLKQRHEELPKLVAACKPYAQFEQALFEGVVRARAQALTALNAHDARAVGVAETQLRSHTSRLIALAEQYPELRANKSFMHLAQRIAELETAIADRRVFYNNTVQLNNAAVEQFPGNLYARIFPFGQVASLQFTVAERVDASRYNG